MGLPVEPDVNITYSGSSRHATPDISSRRSCDISCANSSSAGTIPPSNPSFPAAEMVSASEISIAGFSTDSISLSRDSGCEASSGM